MSLNWDITKISHIPADKEVRAEWYDFANENNSTYAAYADGKPTGEIKHYTNWEVLETIIWRCMAVGIGTITDKNVETFILRSELWAETFGGVKLSRLSIYNHIGLRTNVTLETDAAWWKSFRATVERERMRDIRGTVERFRKRGDDATA